MVVTADASITEQELRRYVLDRLVQFKQQLIADIGRQAYPGGQLRSKNNEPVTGNLTKASETELFFSTQYGELVQAWTEFVPGELLKLGGYYASTFAPSESRSFPMTNAMFSLVWMPLLTKMATSGLSS